MTSNQKPVAVVIGATSKWQSDGRNTRLVHGTDLDDSDLPVGVRWGVGGAIAQKFAQEGFLTVLTTRTAANASRCRQRSGNRAARASSSSLTSRPATPYPMRSPRSGSRQATRMSSFTTQAILTGATCRRKRNCWSTSPSKCSRPHSTSPAAAPSWSPRR